LVRVIQSLVVKSNTNATMDKNNLVEVMDLNGNNDLNLCDGCVYSKHHCIPFPLDEGFHAKEILKFVHTNLCGRMVKTSHGRAKYFITFVDDLSKKTIFLYHED
jgi:hypothetical protein